MPTVGERARRASRIPGSPPDNELREPSRSSKDQVSGRVSAPLRGDVPGEEIADLQRRIAVTCWPSQELVADRSQGVQLAMIQELTRCWATDYDWRKR
jgi:hypothetical protein